MPLDFATAAAANSSIDQVSSSLSNTASWFPMTILVLIAVIAIALIPILSYLVFLKTVKAFRYAGRGTMYIIIGGLVFGVSNALYRIGGFVKGTGTITVQHFLTMGKYGLLFLIIGWVVDMVIGRYKIYYEQMKKKEE